MTSLDKIPDTHNSKEIRNIAINWVGIKNINFPVVVSNCSGCEQHTIANFNMYVNLQHNVKGTHMSRFVEILNNHEYVITIESFKRLIIEMVKMLDAESGHIEMSFPYFVQKSSLVSGGNSLHDYQVSFIGQIKNNSKPHILVKIVVPVTSLFWFLKSVSDNRVHNHRSHVIIYVKMRDFIRIEDLIDKVEKVTCCEYCNLLMQPDEKYQSENTCDKSKFVEDIFRNMAIQFNNDKRITSYKVELESFESNHKPQLISC